MDTSLTEDLLKLSIFKCKMCTRRLQLPIIKVDPLGNICGGCYDRSVYINGCPSTELEEVLSKLYVHCNFCERGCNFENNFINTCLHEKQCYFRDRICPFSYQNECENVLIDNIIDHIEGNHATHVLSVENNLTVLQNPIGARKDAFYLLKNGDEYFLLRIRYNKEEEVFLYSLYYFSSEICCKEGNINFLISMKSKGVKLETERVASMHESNISEGIDESQCVKIDSSILKSLNCFEAVQIYLIRGDTDLYKSALKNEKAEWFKCAKCRKYSFKGAHFCYSCDQKLCHVCYENDAHCLICGKQVSESEIHYQTFTSLFKFPCENENCTELVATDDYELHISICPFTCFDCPYEDDCSWSGIHTNLLSHLKERHEKAVKKDSYTLNCDTESTYFDILIKDKTIFKFWCDLTSDYTLLFEIGTYGKKNKEDYLWTLHVRKPNSQCEVIFSDICREFDDDDEEYNKIYVESFIHNKELQFSLLLKHI